MNLCDDNRITTIEKAKQALIKGTNIEDSPEEMKVLDNILFRCWQMGWLDRYEPQRHFNAIPKGISERLEAVPEVAISTDTISRKAAIDAVEFGITYAKAINKETGEVTALFEESNAELQKAADRIKKLPPAQPEKRTEERTETHGVLLDTISRQAAIEVVQNRHFILSKEKVLLINDLEKMPLAESKIIHCKDCKYFKQVFAPNDNDGLCGHWHSKCDARTSRNGYCSHAER